VVYLVIVQDTVNIDLVAPGAGLDELAAGQDRPMAGLVELAAGQDRPMSGLVELAAGQDMGKAGLVELAAGQYMEQPGLEELLDRANLGLVVGQDMEGVGQDRVWVDHSARDHGCPPYVDGFVVLRSSVLKDKESLLP